MKRLLLASCLFLLVRARMPRSRRRAPLRLTLDEAIARGIEASHRLEELSARQDAARAIEDQREAAERPQLAAIASYTRTITSRSSACPNADGGVQSDLSRHPDNVRIADRSAMADLHRRPPEALTRAAGAEAEAAGQDREAARADLKLEITRAFWAVLTARASADVVRQALERTSAHLTDVRNQLSVGLVPPSDVLTIEAQQAHQRMLSIEAENIVETTSAEFRRLVGLDQDVAVRAGRRPGSVGGMVGPPAPWRSAGS